MMAHRQSRLQEEIATGGDAKTVISIFEFRRNAGTRRRPRHLDVMPPRAASRGAAAAGGWPLRIPLGRNGIVVRVVPIGAPFVHVVAKIVEAIRIRRIQSDWLRRRISSGSRNREALQAHIRPREMSSPSTPPRAARSHSASVGSRYFLPSVRLSQSQYATASNHDTATTGC